jgi:porin
MRSKMYGFAQWHKTTFLCFGLGGCLIGAPAFAQQADSSSPPLAVNADSKSAPESTAAPSPYGDTLFGDWGGLRSYLLDRGINVGFEWAAETSQIVDGGHTRGGGYADQRNFTLDVDWDRLAGISGFKTRMWFTNRAGNDAASKAMGDGLLQVDEIYGGAYDRGVRPIWLSAIQDLWEDRVEIEVGRLPGAGLQILNPGVNSQFQNLSVDGTLREHVYLGGATSWPDTQWGATVRLKTSNDTALKFGLYQEKSFPFAGTSGWDWGFHKTTGTDKKVTFNWTPSFGRDHLLGDYTFGFGWDNQPRTNFLTGKVTYGETYEWVMARQMVQRNGPGPEDGLFLFFQVPYTHYSSVSVISQAYMAGFSDRGFWKSRPQDQVNFETTYYEVSPEMTKAEQAAQAAGQSLGWASTGDPCCGSWIPLYGVRKNAWVMELNYSFHVTDGVQIAPVVQYWIHPGAINTLSNATVLGLTTKVRF